MRFVPDVRSSVAILMTIGALAILGVLLFVDVPDNQIRTMAIGVYFGGFTTVLAYYFGSSTGSKESGDTLRDVVKSQLIGPAAAPSPPP